ncbi:PRMT11 [Symbiodinium pilosum]|uniref:PRMT11 protein n=1 Tax=Symbiodinium pilosum TaxID=2952 RepID=A0A812T9Q7_SYMPI|nr:PRMT11 [Symbiodinium pilosum]
MSQWHPGAAARTRKPAKPKVPEDSGAYSDLGTHREMIEDSVRTEAFRKAIFETCKDKIVLEVGCGTGILSVFAAQAGAKQVIAVEANPEMADLARDVVAVNGFDDNIFILQGCIEEIAAEVDEVPLGKGDQYVVESVGRLKFGKVDVVLSEWMGRAAAQSLVRQCVAFARDRWLKEGGVMLPARCCLHVGPFSHASLVERQTGEPARRASKCHGVRPSRAFTAMQGFWGTTPFGVDLSPLAFHVSR